MLMQLGYQNSKAATEYLAFLNTEDALFQQKVIWDFLITQLPKQDPNSKTFDAGCGNGWLSEQLKSVFTESNIFACDTSSDLIQEAKKKSTKINFAIEDFCNYKPTSAHEFDYIFSIMSAHDTNDLSKMYNNFFNLLKPSKTLFLVIANPYYSFPVAEWKHTFWTKIFGKQPELKIKNYNALKNQTRKFTWGQSLNTYFYPLEEQIKTALKAGFVLKDFNELTSHENTSKFCLKSRLYKVPTILVLTFEKPLK